jgi:hypothetical protein
LEEEIENPKQRLYVDRIACCHRDPCDSRRDLVSSICASQGSGQEDIEHQQS